VSTPSAVEQRRLKYAATINDEALAEDTEPDYELQYVDIGNVDSSGSVHEIATYRFADAPSRARRQVRDGDVIISTVRTYLQAIAPIQQPPDNLIVSTGFAVIHPRVGVFDAGFCKYALREPAFLAEVEMRSVGVSYPAINASDLGDIQIHLPALQHQRAVANYLDRETARLDGLVAAKERVLGLVAEKRRALITSAVTRGLEPSAPLHESGIPWLGEIPAHWKLIPLRFLVDIVGGATPDTGKAEFWDGDIPWVSPKDMKRDEIKDAEDHVSTLALSSSALRLIDPVVVLIVVRGMILAHSFPTAVTTQPVTINQDMKALRCRELLEPRYLRDFLRGLEAWLVSITEESAHGTRRLESEVLGRFQVCVPPIDEQRAIVAYIAAEAAKLDVLRTATERTIALLKERRTALIAAAVTGRIIIHEGTEENSPGADKCQDN
jgi:type I restriction enzyme S subunit